MTWSVSGTSSNSHPVAVRSGCTNIPRAAGGGSGGRDHSNTRLFKPAVEPVRPPGSPGADQALGDDRIRVSAGSDFHRGPLDNDTGGHIPPQRNQQLSCERDDHRFAETASALDPFME